LETAYVAPRSEIERMLATIWQDVLHVEMVGLHDNFFDLGGHSLLLVRIHSKLQDVFRTNISIIDMFKYPTIHALTTHFGQNKSEPALSRQHADSLEKLNAGKNRLKQNYQRKQQPRENG
jgi:acyl carrier protein